MSGPAPIPGWQHRPVRGEAEFLARHERAVQATVRGNRVVGLAIDRDDLASELREALLIAFRRCRWTPPGRDPGSGVVRYALTWKLHNLWRTAQRRGAVPGIDRDVALGACVLAQEDPGLGPVELVAASERELELARLARGLRRELPRDAALLHLRYVEAIPRQVIAEAACIQERQLKAQLETARARAAAFLRELGIATWEDVEP